MSVPYTLASYKVKIGMEDEFVRAWQRLADTFAALPAPPFWGTLIRSRTDPGLFYSFGPWESADDIMAMRQSPEALAAFAAIREFCGELVPGDFEVVLHVEVRPAS